MAGQTFDDRDGWIWFDGELVPWRDARVHVLTHAMHYGSAVFEGERAYGGEVFKSSQHSERLIESDEFSISRCRSTSPRSTPRRRWFSPRTTSPTRMSDPSPGAGRR